ncbi:N-acetyltransferase family protein [Segetibacter sp. 3557_3]|uniref:GNAT family N-acetyltransferase n=1 Tax=Segetibacter sp. 3557_3 TaxID=2547429 RepID=UPI0010586E1A|nr:GNAT family N-acetyltransferase [Segetibacter sp. 3557_3]TDH26447.1 N-acetyltransferase family protein [Segetibacter sp. 3557_3]
MPDWTIRDAAFTDLEAIVNIYNSTVASRMVTADLETISVDSRVAWFTEHDPGLMPLWVAMDINKEIFAWISFQPFYGRAAYAATAEISLYLDERFRGKGLGRELLEYALANSPHFGFKNLLGYIFAHNDASIRLFRAVGFDTWGTLPGIANLDGVERTLLILGKRLAE